MDGKTHAKHKRRPQKFNNAGRAERGRKFAAGKSNIAAKRVTLLPGFLVNGFTSSTAKRAKVEETRGPSLTQDLHAIFDAKHTLRRSKRISKRHEVKPPSPSFSYYTRRSILKNTKSIFREISDKFAEVHLENNNNLPFSPLSKLEDSNPAPEPSTRTPPRFNRTFCESIKGKICVTFKKNAVDECRKNILKEIQMTNLILAGKVRREESVGYDMDDEDCEDQNGGASFPVPQRCWVYRTPKNQSINGPPQLKTARLTPAFVRGNEVFKCKRSAFFNADKPMDYSEQRPLFRMNKQQTANVSFNGCPQDFTFVQEGDEFKIRQSQPKRLLSDSEDEYRDNNRNKAKMFDFSSQERNIFDFEDIL